MNTLYKALIIIANRRNAIHNSTQGGNCLRFAHPDAKTKYSRCIISTHNSYINSTHSAPETRPEIQKKIYLSILLGSIVQLDKKTREQRNTNKHSVKYHKNIK